MGNNRVAEHELAPLAFKLSIQSEQVEAQLSRNSVDTAVLFFYPFLLSLVALGISAAVLNLLFPQWLSWVVAIAPAVLCFRSSKDHYNTKFIENRMKANRKVVEAALNREDAERLAHIAAAILNSQHGNHELLARCEALSGQSTDHFQFLSSVFTFAPECWRECARNVYGRLMGRDVTPVRKSNGWS